MTIDFNKSGGQGDRVKDQFAAGEFEALLDEAELNASGSRAVQFVNDMQERFEEWGTSMYLSPKQREWLESIAWE